MTPADVIEAVAGSVRLQLERVAPGTWRIRCDGFEARSCFDGADKTDPDAAVWRSVYAGMTKRCRAANLTASKGGAP